MKKMYKTLLIPSLMLFLTSVMAQRVMIIEPMGLDAIQTFIEADLVATDTPTVANTIYILRRDATYPYEQEWRPTYALHLEAEPGEGKRPIMLAVHPASGQAPSFARVLNNLTWKGISFPGLDSAGEHSDNAPIRPRGDGFTAIVDDCLIENQRLDVVRMDGSNQKLYFTNNIIRNAYERNLWNKGGGALFMRGNQQDTVIWNHNTFFNTPCVVGYQNDGGLGVEYLEFRNNTIVSVGGLQQPSQYAGVGRLAAINLGIPQTVIVENNIFQNVGYMGIDTQFADRHSVFLIVPTDSTKQIIFRNNNIYMDSVLANVPIPDTAVNHRMWNAKMDSVIAVAMGETGTLSFDFVMENNISEFLEFTNPASTVEEPIMVKALYWSDPANVIFNTLILDLSKDVYDLDYGYPTDAQSYTAGTDGLPLGSKRWHDVISSARDFAPSSEFRLVGNYPNPFYASTTIRFDLERSAQIDVTMFDLTGKVVKRIPAQHFTAGTGHQIQVDALSLSAGVYGYKLTARMSDKTLLASDMMIVE